MDTPEPVEDQAPPVIAVVVTRNPGSELETLLASLGASDYPSLGVLVVDSGSDEDPTRRVAQARPGTFVRRLETNDGFAAAANVALDAVEGAPFLLFCHDDVAFEPTDVRLLVEEAFRSNAGIVGPKLVEYDRPEVLLEVGLSVDRHGVTTTGIEPGELDQEQHDAVVDSFAVSSAAMLVRADLFRALGGFDPATFPGAEGLDLCWRARLLGARVIVMPDARVRHRVSGPFRPSNVVLDPGLLQQARLRTVLKCVSRWSLLRFWVWSLISGTVEVAAFTLTGRWSRVRALVGAWLYQLRHLGELRRARADVQRTRTVRDRELRYLQVRGSTRLRRYLGGRLRTEATIREVSRRGRTLATTAGARARAPAGIALAVFAVLVLVGSRDFLFGTVPAIGSFGAWPGITGSGRAFLSAWSRAGLGTTAPAPPFLAIVSALSTVVFGASGLARTAVVVGAIPLGVLGAWRVGRDVAGRGGPALAVALVYGVNPVARNALGRGELGPLVFFALAPFMSRAVVRVAGLVPRPAARRVRALVGLGASTAICAAFWPPALLLPVLLGVVMLIASLVTGRVGESGRALAVGVGGAVVATVLLFPWPLAFLRSGAQAAALGAVFSPRPGFGEVTRFAVGPAGAGPDGWILLAAGFVALFVARGERWVWAVRAAALTLAGVLLAWLPSRIAPSAAVLSPDGLLVPAALGVALGCGLGVEAFRHDVRRARFGWRQPLAVAAAVAFVVPAVGFVADVGGGRWHTPPSGWQDSLSWLTAERSSGAFTVLWLGDPETLPGSPARRGALAYATTFDGPGDARNLLAPPDARSSPRLVAAVDLAVSGETVRLGRALARLDVRYVAVPERIGPGGDARYVAPEHVMRDLDAQLDLDRVDAGTGIVLYENRAWVRPAARTHGGQTGRYVLVGVEALLILAAFVVARRDRRPTVVA